MSTRSDYLFVGERPIKIHYPVVHRAEGSLFTKKSLNFYRHNDKYNFMSSYVFNPYHMTYNYSFTLRDPDTCRRWDTQQLAKKVGWRRMANQDSNQFRG